MITIFYAFQVLYTTHVDLYQEADSSNLIGWKLEVGVAF